MKHPQHILAFDKQRFGFMKNGFNGMMIQDFLRAAQGSLIIGRRAELETDERYGQMLPYIVFYQTDANGKVMFFTYQRMKGVGESRLAGNLSVGIGGHVDLDDVQSKGSIIDVLGTINNAMIREIREEVKFMDRGEEIQPVLSPVFFGIINDERDPVGMVHYGLLYGIQLPDSVSLSCREDELEERGMYLRPELNHLTAGGGKLEGWTQIVLQQELEFEALVEALKEAK